MSSFRKASKKQSRLRMALCAPPGGGKTFTALRFATELARRPDGTTGKICVINTESGAVEKYLGLNPDGIPFDFDIAEMVDFAPTRYTQLIQEAGREGYDVLLIDSLSHAWAGVGGALELKDKKGGNSFTAWKDITPMHNAMIEAILRSPCHVIATMRTKLAYVLEEEVNQKTGAKIQVPKKIGMEPVQRQGMEYEFDIVADLDQQTHTLTVSKSRCPLVDGAIVVKPGAEFIVPVRQWLEEGVAIDPAYFAVRPEELRAQADVDAAQAAEESAIQRRNRLLAMANESNESNGNGSGNGSHEAAAAPKTETDPPFDPNPPGATDDRAAKLAALQELVAAGAALGRTPQQISDECVAKLGAKPSDLPLPKLRALIGAFRKCAAAANAGAAPVGDAAPKNQPAA